MDQGRLLGSWDAHDDAVCCASMLSLGPPGDGGKLVTGSWDCTVKVWELAEGRCPWGSGLSQPLAELRDFDSGVWALAAGGGGGGPLSGPSCIVTGTEEGLVQAWDLRDCR